MGRRKAQQLMPGIGKVPSAEHGGDKSLGRRKIARPVGIKHAMHLCLRSSLAKGEFNLRRSQNFKRVASIVREESTKHNVRIHSWANVGNHIHFMLRVYRRDDFRNFLRAFSGRTSMAVTGARKGKPLGRRFWDHLAYSRLCTSRREEMILGDYVDANQIEAESPMHREVFQLEQAEMRRRRTGKRGLS
jgi:REP element-mobilizing transposase RayT